MAKYDEIRSKIKTGDILAWTHRGGWFRSWYDFKINLVRLFTRSEYSHVGIAVVWAGRVMVLESVTGGIRLFPLSKLTPCYWIKYRSKLFDLDRAMSVFGQPYSEIEAVKGKFGRTDDTNGKWQCAKFVRWANSLGCAKDNPSSVVNHVLERGGVMQAIEI